jgi:high-affinity K+ transport system ATPase subunit B
MLWKSLPDALRKLNPGTLWRNPVMFIVWVGAVFSTLLAIVEPSAFAWVIVVWLWLTVVFGAPKRTPSHAGWPTGRRWRRSRSRRRS